MAVLKKWLMRVLGVKPKKQNENTHFENPLTVQGLGTPSKEEIEFFQYLDFKEFMWSLNNHHNQVISDNEQMTCHEDDENLTDTTLKFNSSKFNILRSEDYVALPRIVETHCVENKSLKIERGDTEEAVQTILLIREAKHSTSVAEVYETLDLWKARVLFELVHVQPDKVDAHDDEVRKKAKGHVATNFVNAKVIGVEDSLYKVDELKQIVTQIA